MATARTLFAKVLGHFVIDQRSQDFSRTVSIILRRRCALLLKHKGVFTNNSVEDRYFGSRAGQKSSTTQDGWTLRPNALLSTALRSFLTCRAIQSSKLPFPRPFSEMTSSARPNPVWERQPSSFSQLCNRWMRSLNPVLRQF